MAKHCIRCGIGRAELSALIQEGRQVPMDCLGCGHEEEIAALIEQAIADLFPDEFPIYEADAGGDGKSRCVGDHTALSMVTMLCRRFVTLREEDRVWDKSSLVQIVAGRGELRERVKVLTEACRITASIKDTESLSDIMRAVMSARSALNPAKETA